MHTGRRSLPARPAPPPRGSRAFHACRYETRRVMSHENENNAKRGSKPAAFCFVICLSPSASLVFFFFSPFHIPRVRTLFSLLARNREIINIMVTIKTPP